MCDICQHNFDDRVGSLLTAENCPEVTKYLLHSYILVNKRDHIVVMNVLFDTGFGFRVQVDLVPRAFGAWP